MRRDGVQYLNLLVCVSCCKKVLVCCKVTQGTHAQDTMHACAGPRACAGRSLRSVQQEQLEGPNNTHLLYLLISFPPLFIT